MVKALLLLQLLPICIGSIDCSYEIQQNRDDIEQLRIQQEQQKTDQWLRDYRQRGNTYRRYNNNDDDE
jgi:hypothetical protein